MKSFLSFICAVWFTAALYGQSITLSPAANRYMDIPSGQAPAPVTISRQHTAEIPRLVRASSSTYSGTGACSFNDVYFNVNGIDQWKTVGEIGVQHQVTPTGATMYTVPIEIVPGRNGTQPALSLVYNNMSGNGPLGYGWSLGGLSAITRTGKSPYYDGVAGPVDFAAEGPFVLDGMRLILSSGSSTVNTYTSERGHLRIESYLSGSKVKYFKVWYPNGSTGVYGNEYNSDHKLSFPLMLFTDALGNTVKYVYEEGNNQYRIKNITYGASRARNSDYATIRFSYQNPMVVRKDISEVFVAGLQIAETQLLTEIQCDDYRTYWFDYYLGNDYSLLDRIHCRLPSGLLSPLRMAYGESQNSGFYSKSSRLTEWFDNTSVGNLVVTRGKFDLWSDDDALIVYPNQCPYVEVKVSSGMFQHSQHYYTSQFHPDQKLLVYPGIADDYVIPVIMKAGDGFMELTSGDTDGIPGDEVIKISNLADTGQDILSFKIYKPYSLGSYIPVKSFDFPVGPSLVYANRYSITPKVFCVGDFAGTGRMQVLSVSRSSPLNTSNATRVMLFDLHDGQILYNSTALTFKANNDAGDILFGIDYNGDGRADICHIHADGADVYVSEGAAGNISFRKVAGISEIKRDMKGRKFLVGDINGDGKTDFLLSPEASKNEWKIFYSMGLSGFSPKTVTLENCPSYLDYVLHDVNNDGRADLVRMSSTGKIEAFLVTGNSISGSPEWSNSNTLFPDKNYLIATSVAKQGHHTQLLVLNNSRVELFRFMRDNSRQRMLSLMISSTGVITSTGYGKLNEGTGDYYTSRSGAVFPYENFDGPLWVTTCTQVWHNKVKHKDYSYRYGNAVAHRQGLGFCGFGDFTVYDNMRGLYQTQTFDPYRFGVMVKEESPVSKTESEYNVSVAPNKTALVQMNRQKIEDKLKGYTTDISYSDYTYGNPGKITTDYGGGIKTTMTYQYHNSDSPYILGQPREEKCRKERNGASWETLTRFSYHPNSQLAGKTGFVNNLEVASESYEYDAAGNLVKESKKTFGGEVMETRYEYDSNLRWVVRETDPMNLSTRYDYDSYGRVTMSTDYLGNATTYEYDGLSRVTKVKTPDGVEQKTTYKWDYSNGALKGDYSVEQETTNLPRETNCYDALGRLVKNKINKSGGSDFVTCRTYDQLGRLYRVSDPPDDYMPVTYSEYSYDRYDRVTRVVHSTGRVVTTSYSGNSVTINDAGQVKTMVYDATGALVQVTDPGGRITYTLRPDGQPSSIMAPNGSVTRLGYDNYGRKNRLEDPSAGTLQYEYNTEGRLYKQKNARGQVTEFQYNKFGLPVKQITPEQTTVYTYRNTDYKPETIVTGNQSVSFGYDRLGRLVQERKQVEDLALQKNYTYQYGRIQKVEYDMLSGKPVSYEYGSYGYTKKVAWDGKNILSNPDINRFGQLTDYRQGVDQYILHVNRNYSPNGIPKQFNSYSYSGSTQAQSQTSIAYTFDEAKGLLSQRKHNNMTESFGYDDLRRLTSYGNPGEQGTVTYNNMGSILSKTDAGVLSYDDMNSPYRLTERMPAGAVTIPRRSVSYTSFDRPLKIAVPQADSAMFTYGHDFERTTMTMYGSDKRVKYKRYYLGNLERTVKNGNTTDRIYLDGTPYTARAVAIRENSGSWNLYYIIRDYLGSIVGLSNGVSPVEELSYDAWGNTRNPATQQLQAVNLKLDRGFTGHEHLPEFGLINMNARLYDPLTGQFLSPDPFVQSPDFSQSFNRYAYCWNNPLIFTDPDGEFIILSAILIGAAIGTYMGYKVGKAHNASGWGMAGYMLGGALIGGVAGGVSAGVGLLAAPVVAGAGLGGFSAGAIVGAAAGASAGLINGFGMSLLGGSTLGDAFAVGGKSALMGALTGAAVGGAIQGFIAVKHNMNFWTGKPIAPGRGAFAFNNSPMQSSSRHNPQLKYSKTELDLSNTRGEVTGENVVLETKVTIEINSPGERYAFGLKDRVEPFAKRIDAKHLMEDINWKTHFPEIINNPKNEIHFLLDGIDDTPMRMILSPGRSGINWELNILYNNPAFENTIFHYNSSTFTGYEMFNIPF